MKQNLTPLAALALAGFLVANDARAQNKPKTDSAHVAPAAGYGASEDSTKKTVKYPMSVAVSAGLVTSSHANPAVYRRGSGAELGVHIRNPFNAKVWQVGAGGKVAANLFGNRTSKSDADQGSTNVREFITDNRMEVATSQVYAGIGPTINFGKVRAHIHVLEATWKTRAVFPYDTVRHAKQAGGKMSLEHLFSGGQSLHVHFNNGIHAFARWGITPDSHLMKYLNAPANGIPSTIERERFNVWQTEAGVLINFSELLHK
jgi:hypothetical protein